MAAAARIVRVDWPEAFRIVSARYNPVAFFEDIADPADWDLLAAALAKTDPGFWGAIGDLSRVPANRRVAGPGASWVMTAFTHASPDRPGRFHTGTDGAYYAGDRFEVAVFETIHHFERFMRATREPPLSAGFRELVGSVRGDFHDLRDPAFDGCHDPDSYAESHRVASRLRQAGSNGIVYRSVRYPGGECIAAFHPDTVDTPRLGRALRYHWDGTHVATVEDLASGDLFRVRR